MGYPFSYPLISYRGQFITLRYMYILSLFTIIKYSFICLLHLAKENRPPFVWITAFFKNYGIYFEKCFSFFIQICVLGYRFHRIHVDGRQLNWYVCTLYTIVTSILGLNHSVIQSKHCQGQRSQRNLACTWSCNRIVDSRCPLQFSLLFSCSLLPKRCLIIKDIFACRYMKHILNCG